MQGPLKSDSAAFFKDNYTIVANYQYAVCPKQIIRDLGTERTCRFCTSSSPKATFRNVAHAIPEFLGNRNVLSHNECDSCNARLAHEYEDHLAKWSHLLRSLTKIRGKKGLPSFKNDSVRIDPEKENLRIRYNDPTIERPSETDVPFDMELEGDSHSQPYIPLRAAMALTKISISICPPEHLNEMERAIAWLNEPDKAQIQGVLVGYGFTPGVVPPEASRVLLLKRMADNPIPYFWLVIQCQNFRLQTFVPLCKSDENWWLHSSPIELPLHPYTCMFGDSWLYGKSSYDWCDWSSTQLERTPSKASFRFLSIKKEDGQANSDETPTRNIS